MAVTLAEVEAAAEQALALVAKLAPLAGLGGPAAGAIGVVVGQVASAIDTIIAQATSDAAVIGSGNLANIQALQVKLQAANAQLAAQIASS